MNHKIDLSTMQEPCQRVGTLRKSVDTGVIYIDSSGTFPETFCLEDRKKYDEEFAKKCPNFDEANPVVGYVFWKPQIVSVIE